MHSDLWLLLRLASCTHCLCFHRSCRTGLWHSPRRCLAIWSLMQKVWQTEMNETDYTLTSVYNSRCKDFYLRGFCHQSARWVQSWWWAEPALNSWWLSHHQQGWKELRHALGSPRRDITLLSMAWNPTFSKQCLCNGGWTTDQYDLLLQEVDVDAVNVDVDLIQKRYSLVTATSDVFTVHLELYQTDVLCVLHPGENIGIRALEVVGHAVKCFEVRIPWDRAPVKI